MFQGNNQFYYHTDHLGSASYITDNAADVIQQIAYLPYGEDWIDIRSNGFFGSAYKFNGKEKDPESGLHYAGARYYDSRLSIFNSTDPLWWKYPHLSPYNYCANNPVNAVDLKGDSITVLNQGGVIGHSALLIQNEIGKWQYFSMNGDGVYENTRGVVGGKPYHDKGEKTFNSPQEFLESSYNTLGSKEQVANNEVNNYEFKEGYILPTTPEQDKRIKETFKQSVSEGYNLSSNQCSQVVQKSLNAAGITTTEVTEKTVINRKTGTIHNYQVTRNPYLPNNTFRAIIKNNPQGKYIKSITNR